MATVRIPTPLRKLTRDQEVVTIPGANIEEILAGLETQFPGMKERLVNAEGKINRFVNIFLTDEDIRFIDDKATAVQDTDEISIVPAIAGG